MKEHSFNAKKGQIIFIILFIFLNILNGFLVNSSLFNKYLSTYNRTLLMYVNYFFGDFGFMLLLLGLGVLIFKSNYGRMIYQLVITIILSIICIMDSMYIYNYETVFTFSNLQALNNPAGGMAWEFLFSVAKILLSQAQYLTLVPIIIISIYFSFLKRKDPFLKENIFGNKKNRIYLSLSFLIIAVLLMLNAFSSYSKKIEDTWFEDNTQTLYGIQTTGMYNYYIYDFYATYLSNISKNRSEKNKEIQDYLLKVKNPLQKNMLDNLDYGANLELSGIYQERNLIIIQLESFNNYLIGLCVDGVEVTPNINKLAKDGSYWNNFYSNVGIGNTSDAEFSVMTGLFPDGNHVSVFEYEEVSFDTLAKAFNRAGYNTFSVHGNVESFYSRGSNHLSLYGFNNHYGQEKLQNKTGLVHNWINDYDLLQQSLDIMKASSSLDFAFPITISAHTPYEDDEVIKAKLAELNFSLDNIDSSYLRGYLEHMHYVDWAVGEFINKLNSNYLDEETVVLIYGDHGGGVDEEDLTSNLALFTNTLNPFSSLMIDNASQAHIYYYRQFSRQVPLIIYEASSDKSLETNTYTLVRHQGDIFRTVVNLFSLDSDYYFGNDLYSLAPGLAYNPRNLDCFTDEGMLILPKKIIYDQEVSEDRLKEIILITQSIKDINDKLLRHGG